MQYRGMPFGPSGNRWPRCPPHTRQDHLGAAHEEVLSSWSATASATAGGELGHPVPELNLVPDSKSRAPQPAQ